MKQKISFIVPVFNHVEQSREMLDSLLSSVPRTVDFEVIVVDDGSSDGTRSWLAGLRHARVRPLFNEANVGYARSNNRAVQQATGDVLGLLNNDLILLPGWLEPMLELLGSPSANAGIVGNVQVRVDDGVVDHAGIEVDHLAKIEHIRALPPDGEAGRRVLAVTGACCLVSRQDFVSVGGFDERYLNGGEDVDLCLKLRARRRYAYVAAKSRVRHHVSLTRSISPQSRERGERNSRLLFGQWRHVIQWETRNAWMRILSSPADADHARIIRDFCLGEAYRGALHAVSGILAKSSCHREVARWREMLDGEVPNRDPLPLAAVQGLRWGGTTRFEEADVAGRYPWVDGRARLALPTGLASRGLAVSGRILTRRGAEGQVAQRFVITLQINGVQTATWAGHSPGEFRVGLDRPAALDQHDSLVTLGVTWMADDARLQGRWRQEALQAVRVCTLVADGDLLLDFGKQG